MLTCSATCVTFSMPVRLVFDLLPRSYHDSTPGRMALKPLFCRRLRCVSLSTERLLSAMCLMRVVGSARSSVSMHSSNRTPKFGSCQPTIGFLCFVSRNWMSSDRPVESERLVLHRRVDAEAAGVGAAEAREHRHDLDDRGLGQRLLDVLPSLGERGEVLGLLGRCELPARRAVLLPVGAECRGRVLRSVKPRT